MDVVKSVIIAVVAVVPALLAGTAVAVHALGAPVDPLTPDEEKIIESIAKSRWAQELASAMTTTPEARERISKMLAMQLYKTVGRVTD